MSPEAFDKNALIRYRMEKARETLEDAYALRRQERTPASVVNRAYYAMFYATLALLLTSGYDSSKHSGVIALFDRHFVKTNILPREMSRMLHEAFESRQEGDYQDVSKIDDRIADETLNSAKTFIKTIEEKLAKQP
jgi:uncharacterized protein (UPF0332 family)